MHTASSPILSFSSSLLSQTPHPPCESMVPTEIQSSSQLASALSCPSCGWHVSFLLGLPLSVLVEHRVLTRLSLCVSRLEHLSLPVTLEVATLWGWQGQELHQASPWEALNGMWVTSEILCPGAGRRFSCQPVQSMLRDALSTREPTRATLWCRWRRGTASGAPWYCCPSTRVAWENHWYDGNTIFFLLLKIQVLLYPLATLEVWKLLPPDFHYLYYYLKVL